MNNLQKARHWSLGAKLVLVATPFLLMALATIAVTMWVAWQLEGGAAAINEAGRMRMQSYQMSLSISTTQSRDLPKLAGEFTKGLETLRAGDPERPLFMPWDDAVRTKFGTVEKAWAQYQQRWIASSRVAFRADLRIQ